MTHKQDSGQIEVFNVKFWFHRHKSPHCGRAAPLLEALRTGPACYGSGGGRGKKWESADKPGSVVDNHSSGMCVATHLKQPTREHARVARCRLKQASADLLSYLVLLRAGFAVPVLLPVLRCALTAPFHPYQQQTSCCFGGLLSVALSVDSRPPGVTWRSTLWSPDFPPVVKPRAVV